MKLLRYFGDCWTVLRFFGAVRLYFASQELGDCCYRSVLVFYASCYFLGGPCSGLDGLADPSSFYESVLDYL